MMSFEYYEIHETEYFAMVEGLAILEAEAEKEAAEAEEADFWAMVAAAEWERFEGCFD